MTELGDRIAEAIELSDYNQRYRLIGNYCAHRLADAVIAALGMVQETDYGTTYPRLLVTDQRLIRYVTDWKAD